MLKILLAEDYPSFADIACDVLAKSGYPVSHVATNGNAAMEALDESKYPRWDAVITDWDLNYGPNGARVAERALGRDVPLVVLWSSIDRTLDLAEHYPGLDGSPGLHVLRKDALREAVALLRRHDPDEGNPLD